jgi:hypothetical protein
VEWRIEIERSYGLDGGYLVSSVFAAFIRIPRCETGGHSIAFTGAPDGAWLCVDDGLVAKFSDEQVHGIFAAQCGRARPLILCFARMSLPVAIARCAQDRTGCATTAGFGPGGRLRPHSRCC